MDWIIGFALAGAWTVGTLWIVRHFRRAAALRRTMPVIDVVMPEEERRAYSRRMGKPTAVHVVAVEEWASLVIDRAAGGLRLESPRELRVGQVIQIRAQANADEAAWVNIEVRHVKEESGGWLVGCKFAEPPAPEILRQFS